MRNKARQQPATPPAEPPRPLYVRLANSPLDQRATMAAMGTPGEDVDRRWFRMKFTDDGAELRPERGSYYKYHVEHFVREFFNGRRVDGKRILDLGCGPGFYSALLSERGAIVTGIDMSPFLIAKAKDLAARRHLDRLDLIEGDFIDFAAKSAPKSFDIIIAIDTFVSFDYDRPAHDAERVRRAFAGVKRLLKDDGACFVIESHPFFGQVVREIPTDTGETFCLRSSHYKIEHKLKSDVHHWFTLSEMSQATSANGLAIFQIYEPEPSPALQQESPSAYAFRRKYPAMVVYEIRPMK